MNCPYENEDSVVLAQLSGFTTEGKHEISIFNNSPSTVKVIIEHDGNETTVTIEEIEE